MADETPEPEAAEEIKRPEYKCNACEDTGRVHLPLAGKTGPILREVPCPECQAGVTLAMERDAAMAQLRDDLRNLALAVLVAVGLAMIALMATRGNKHVHENGFAEAVREEVKQ